MFNHKDFGLIDAAYPPMDTSYFEDDMLTLVCRLKLKSKVAYGFYLPFYQFRSADGYRMAQNQLIYFTTTGYTALPPVDNYGYRIEKESVIFSYKIPPNFSGEITTVAVAGNFNSWNPSTEGFQLKKISSDLYELSVAKKQ
ncbi:MAG: hypothetical protein IPP72_13770 [Chitinophagaceae bacterium]|nr:hypothetical protein [Chitinophagaceae bacterium]